jgi:hypothetical protein
MSELLRDASSIGNNLKGMHPIGAMVEKSGLSPTSFSAGIEGLGSLGLGVAGAAGVIGLLGDQALQGFNYSFLGAERILASGMGNVYSTLSPDELSKTLRIGEKTLRYKDVFFPASGNPVSNLDNIFARGGTSGGVGLQAFSKINVALPLGMTALGGIHAYATEGMTGLGNYLIQDLFANKYGMEASLEVLKINDATKALPYLQGDSSAVVEGGSVQRAKGGLFNAPLAFRIQSIMGGYVGAAAGMEVGRSLGEITASYFNMNETKQSILGFVGSVFGAAGGAKVGAYMGGSFARLGLMGLGIGAVSVMKSYMQDSLGGGANLKHRGLNYAGDIAAFQTQMASTMRQRSLQAMHKSSINARSAFGQEAGMVHMNRDMFSQYRR